MLDSGPNSQTEDSKSASKASGFKFERLRTLYESGAEVLNTVNSLITKATTVDEFWDNLVEAFQSVSETLKPDAWLLAKSISAPTKKTKILYIRGCAPDRFERPEPVHLDLAQILPEGDVTSTICLEGARLPCDFLARFSTGLPFKPEKAVVANIHLVQDVSVVLVFIVRSWPTRSVWLDSETFRKLVSVWAPLIENCYSRCERYEQARDDRIQTLDALSQLAGLFMHTSNRNDMIESALGWVMTQLNVEVSAILLEDTMDLREFLVRVVPNISQKLTPATLKDKQAQVKVLESVGHKIAKVKSTTPPEVYIISEEDLNRISRFSSKVINKSIDEMKADPELSRSPMFSMGWTGSFYVSDKRSDVHKDFHSSKLVVRDYEGLFTKEMKSQELRHCAITKLVAGGRNIGVLRVTNKVKKWTKDGRPILAENGFSEEDISLLEILAAGLSLAMSYSGLLKEHGDLRHLTDDLFVRIAKAMKTGYSRDALRELGEYAGILLPQAETFDVAVYDDEENSYKNEVSSERKKEGEPALWVTPTLIERMKLDGDMVCLLDGEDSGLLFSRKSSISALRIGIPNLGEILGVLNLESSKLIFLPSDERQRIVRLIRIPVIYCALVLATEQVQRLLSRFERHMKENHAVLLAAAHAYPLAHEVLQYLRQVSASLAEPEKLAKGDTNLCKRLHETEDALTHAADLTTSLMDLSKGLTTNKAWEYIDDIMRPVEDLTKAYLLSEPFRNKRLTVSFMPLTSKSRRPANLTDDAISEYEESGECPPSHPVFVDINQIREVALNLISNAAKVSYPRQTIKVKWGFTVSESEWFLAVTDYGCGFDPYVKSHMFRPFFSKTDGFGFGLTICDQLAAEHGGRIECDSTGEGQGATFRLILPIDGKAKNDNNS